MKGRRRNLTPEEWRTAAGRIREATEALASVDSLLSESLTVAAIGPYRKVFGEVQALRSSLDDLAVRQHPDWPDATRLFYGDGWTWYSAWR